MDVKLIKALLMEDKKRTNNSYRRHPIRYVFMNLNENTQDDLGFLMEGENCDFIDLSEKTKRKKNGWLTKGEVKKIIEKCDLNRDSFIVGFSEWFRFCSNSVLESFVLSLCDFENPYQDSKNGENRIYIICFSMKEHLYKILHNKHHRLNVYNPFINAEFDFQNVFKEIYFTNEKIAKLASENVITDSINWLALWRNASLIDLNKPIICFSPVLQEWYRIAAPDNAFQIDIVESIREYILKLYNINIPFEYREQDDKQWIKLIHIFKNNKTNISISDILKDVLGIKKIDSIVLASKWIVTENSFEKWLISNYVKSYMDDSFLALIFKLIQSERSDEFQNLVWELGFSDITKEMYSERRNLLNELNKYADFVIPEQMISTEVSKKFNAENSIDSSFNIDYSNFDIEGIGFHSTEDREKFFDMTKSYFQKWFLFSYSGLSNFEKELVINFYKNGIIEIDEIKDCLPELYNYLNEIGGIKTIDYWLDEYFVEYRKSKLLNKDTKKLEKLVAEYNLSEETFFKWYYGLKRQDVLLKDKNREEIYIIDGVSGEYMPYICFLVEKYGYKVLNKQYAVCSLPSVTYVNKEKIKEYKIWYTEFDVNIVHGETYSSARNIRKALVQLDEIIRKIAIDARGKDFIITADHGSTARAKWTKPIKKYNYTGADHEGRCYNIHNDVKESTRDYIFYKGEDNWLISLRDISLNNNPKYENHGGATIEEVVVPYIWASKCNAVNQIEYKVSAIKLNVDGLDKKIKFAINPKPEKVDLVEENGNIKAMIFDDGVWYAKLSIGKQQKVRVIVDNQAFEFCATSRASIMMREDDGFDD